MLQRSNSETKTNTAKEMGFFFGGGVFVWGVVVVFKHVVGIIMLTKTTTPVTLADRLMTSREADTEQSYLPDKIAQWVEHYDDPEHISCILH